MRAFRGKVNTRMIICPDLGDLLVASKKLRLQTARPGASPDKAVTTEGTRGRRWLVVGGGRGVGWRDSSPRGDLQFAGAASVVA